MDTHLFTEYLSRCHFENVGRENWRKAATIDCDVSIMIYNFHWCIPPFSLTDILKMPSRKMLFPKLAAILDFGHAPINELRTYLVKVMSCHVIDVKRLRIPLSTCFQLHHQINWYMYDLIFNVLITSEWNTMRFHSDGSVPVVWTMSATKINMSASCKYTHWGRVTHRCVGNLCHHWFR